MPKKEYKFNPQTLTYEVVAAPFRLRFYRFLRRVLIGFILACVVNFLFSFFFYTPKMHRISKDNRELLMQYGLLQDRIQAASHRLDEIRHRDNAVYRPLFAADTLALPGIYIPYPERRYAHLQGDEYSALITDTWKSLDDIARRIYLESKSFDELQVLARDKEKLATSIPAIWPVDKRNVRGNIGAFGPRNHPIYHRYIVHEGIDLGGHIGDPVYATGDAVVIHTETGLARRGYGKQILLDHGFGYRTRYAHLSKILVAQGQKVRRGELIGLVGSTGGSTGPHLHYEVMYTGRHVNPINYFRRDMDEAEFERIIRSARATTFESD